MPTDFPPTTSTTSALLQPTLLTSLPFITSTPLPSTTSSPLPPTTRPLELIPIIVGAAGGAIALLLLIILIIVCCICCERESDYYDKPLEGTRGRFRSTRKKKFEPTSFAIQNKAYIPQVLGVGQDKPANGTTKDGDEGYAVDETHALWTTSQVNTHIMFMYILFCKCDYLHASWVSPEIKVTLYPGYMRGGKWPFPFLRGLSMKLPSYCMCLSHNDVTYVSAFCTCKAMHAWSNHEIW